MIVCKYVCMYILYIRMWFTKFVILSRGIPTLNLSELRKSSKPGIEGLRTTQKCSTSVFDRFAKPQISTKDHTFLYAKP